MAAALILTETFAVTTALLFPLISLSTSIFSGVQYLSKFVTDDTELSQLSEKLENILHESEIMYKFIETEKISKDSKSIELYIQNLEKNLQELNSVLLLMINKIERHHNKWFHRVRRFNISKEKKQMILILEQIERKFSILTQMILILKK